MTDEHIDALVHDLDGLTEEEIKIVECRGGQESELEPHLGGQIDLTTRVFAIQLTSRAVAKAQFARRRLRSASTANRR